MRPIIGDKWKDLRTLPMETKLYESLKDLFMVPVAGQKGMYRSRGPVMLPDGMRHVYITQEPRKNKDTTKAGRPVFWFNMAYGPAIDTPTESDHPDDGDENFGHEAWTSSQDEATRRDSIGDI